MQDNVLSLRMLSATNVAHQNRIPLTLAPGIDDAIA
jgi:hypothetical protein